MIETGTLNKETWQKQMDTDGYAVVTFADASMLTELSEFYHSLSNLPLSGTHVTMFNPSYEYRKLVDDKIKQVCAARAKQLMPGYRVLYTNFMVKEPGMEGDFPLHQDWTYVDESKCNSYALWVPLRDVDETNGTLHVVKGSHRFYSALRGPHVHEPFGGISATIKEKYSVPVKLSAGEALVWDHRLIHFSKPNMSQTPRLAFTLIMVPESEQIIHCYGLGGSATQDIEIFEVDTEFFMQYTIGQRPENVPLLNTVAQVRKDFTAEEFDKVFSK